MKIPISFIDATFYFRFISVEELDQALKEFNIHDGRDINEILSEVDADKVSPETEMIKVL